MTSDALHLRGVFLPDETELDAWVVGDRLTFERIPGAVTVARGGWVIPGLVDAHCHIGIGPGGPVADLATARELALRDREVGVLAIRDAGSPLQYPELEDDVELPRLVRAGRHLARTKRYLPGFAVECEPHELADHARDQARRGSGWIKLVGDWIDRSLGDLAPTFDAETLTAAVTAAHTAGAKVAVHTFSEAALPDLLAAGVDSIEHGTGLTAETIAIMAERRTALVPTMTNIENFPDYAARGEAKFPDYAAHMRRLHRNFPKVVAAAYEAGVPIYAGTDAGGVVGHGLLPGEIARLHRAGLSATDALASGSWAARDWLGLPGLVEGGLADLVVYDADPRADLSVLHQPTRIVLRGRVVR